MFNYDNIGKKIKGAAKAIFIIESILSLIVGLIIVTNFYDFEVVLGILLMIIGPIVAWVSSWLLYGFGELIDKVSGIERNTRGDKTTSETQASIDERDSQILGNAGEKSSLVCAKCGTKYDSPIKFCGECGNKMD